MIRPAAHADLDGLIRIGALFHEEAGYSDIAEYRPEDFRSTLTGMIDSDAAILLVVDDGGTIGGMAGGLVFPLYFNAGHRTGQEMFWYVAPEYRNGAGTQLLTALEAAARSAGCESWIMIALDNIKPEATGRLYRGRGYRPAEHSWIRRL